MNISFVARSAISPKQRALRIGLLSGIFFFLEVEAKPSPYGDETVFVYHLPDVVSLALTRRTARDLLERKCRYLVLDAFRNVRWKRKFWLDGSLLEQAFFLGCHPFFLQHLCPFSWETDPI